MNKDKIEVSIKDIPEIIETLKETEKEIEFERKSKNLFMDDLYKVCDMSLKQQQEIERLNNIINEIEAIIYNNQITGIEARLEIQERLDKLQELKDSDKE